VPCPERSATLNICYEIFRCVCPGVLGLSNIKCRIKIMVFALFLKIFVIFIGEYNKECLWQKKKKYLLKEG